MGLKKAENQVKILLAETIMALCRNTLNNHAEVSVEGLLGITLDNDEIFLVSINQTINNPDVPSKKRTFEEDGAEIECKKSRTDCSESENENDSEKKARRRKRRRRRRSSDGGSEESSDSDDSDSVKTEPVGESGARGDFSETPRSTNKTNFSRVRIKRESNESEDQDLVIVKEELGDHHGNVASTSEFPFMAQSFHNLQQLASTSLNNFQPPNSSMNDSIASHSQQSMELSSPQPGPSINQPGVSEEEGMFAMATDVLNDRHAHSKRLDCFMCGRIFQNRGKLKRHMIVHTGAKFHRCDLCSKEFGMKSSLKRHWINVHKRPFIEPYLELVNTHDEDLNHVVQLA